MGELRRTLSKASVGQSVPDCLEGKVTEDTILDKFRECYQDLYNSAGTQGAMFKIKEKLKLLTKEDSVTEVEKITGDIVKTA